MIRAASLGRPRSYRHQPLIISAGSTRFAVPITGWPASRVAALSRALARSRARMTATQRHQRVPAEAVGGEAGVACRVREINPLPCPPQRAEIGSRFLNEPPRVFGIARGADQKGLAGALTIMCSNFLDDGELPG